jgi:phytoene dehydrogenase-like protein
LDAVVVGAGPNGLSAAITLAQAGRSVLLIEGEETVGGAARAAELTLPGFIHDVCSAIYPLTIGSPYLSKLPLERHGLRWIQPPLALAHPLDNGTAAVLSQQPHETLESLDPDDARAWERLLLPLSDDWERLAAAFLGPLNPFKDPFFKARFGLLGLRSAESLVRARFRGVHARALFGGIAGHSFLPLDLVPTASFGLVLAATGHAVGWSQPEGGSQRIPDALAALFLELGGEIVTGWKVKSLDELPRSSVVLLDLTPAQLLRLEGTGWPSRYRRQLGRFRYGPGVFKIDWALREPIPWRAEEWGRRFGALGLGRPRVRPAARPGGAAEPLRPDAGAGRVAHRLGLLPRAQRLPGGHDGDDRAPDRALCARLPRGRAGAPLQGYGLVRSPQPQPGRRRHQRGRRPADPALHPAGGPARPVLHVRPEDLPVLGEHASDGRGAWDVRPPRGSRGDGGGRQESVEK